MLRIAFLCAEMHVFCSTAASETIAVLDHSTQLYQTLILDDMHLMINGLSLVHPIFHTFFSICTFNADCFLCRRVDCTDDDYFKQLRAMMITSSNSARTVCGRRRHPRSRRRRETCGGGGDTAIAAAAAASASLAAPGQPARPVGHHVLR